MRRKRIFEGWRPLRPKRASLNRRKAGIKQKAPGEHFDGSGGFAL